MPQTTPPKADEKKSKKKTTKKKTGVIRKKYSDETKAKACRLYKSGKSTVQIQKALKISSEGVIYHWLTDAGIPTRRAAANGGKKIKTKKKRVTKKSTGARRRRKPATAPVEEGDEAVDPKHKKKAQQVFSNAQREFRKLISDCARSDDFEGVDFFNDFAAQVSKVRKKLVA